MSFVVSLFLAQGGTGGSFVHTKINLEGGIVLMNDLSTACEREMLIDVLTRDIPAVERRGTFQAEYCRIERILHTIARRNTTVILTNRTFSACVLRV